MANIFKMSNRGGVKSLTDYTNMLAGNAVWNPWQPAGAYDALATVTVPSGGLTSIEFAGIPTGYKHLQIRSISQTNKATYGIDSLKIRFNADSGSSYSQHEIYGDGSGTVGAGGLASQTSIYVDTTNASSATSTFGPQIIEILDYANTSKNKTIRTLCGSDHNGSIAGYNGQIAFGSGAWYNTNAIKSISITPWVGTAWNQHSQFALYGVK